MNTIKYIRFGKIPASGHSFNSMDNTTESGVSCYRLVLTAGEWRIDGAYGSYMMSLNSANCPCFEITGDLLQETGSDGEPLLQNAKIIRKHTPKAYSDCWQKLTCAQIGSTEAIYRHFLTGEIWVALSGVEFRASREETIKRISGFTYPEARKSALLAAI